MNFLKKAILRIKFDNFGKVVETCKADSCKNGNVFDPETPISKAIALDAAKYAKVFGGTHDLKVGLALFSSRIPTFDNNDYFYVYFGCDWGRKEARAKCFDKVRKFAVRNMLTLENYDFLSYSEWLQGAIKPGGDIVFVPMEEFEDGKPLLKKAGPEKSIEEMIGDWKKETSYDSFEKEITKEVIGQPEVSGILTGIYSYLSGAAKGRPGKHNMIVVAPSGTGKTETYRVLRKYFRDHLPALPVAQVDLSLITAEGFKGKNTKYVIMPLLEKSETNGIGIIFLDEFDKKLIPSYSGNGDNVNGSIQSQILTTIEGSSFSAEIGNDTFTVNTENTLFIALGSFNEVRKERGELRKKAISGFGKETVKEVISHYEPITKEDMIRLGGSYELLGRFPIVVNFRRLDVKSIDCIIDKITFRLQEDLAVGIFITDEFREVLRKEANSEYGCRKLESMIMSPTLTGLTNLLREEKTEDYLIRIMGDGTPEIGRKMKVETEQSLES